ncbi:uncharacterized protein LOC62_01G001563 [Vanrija pseudolonga]|uniref:Uncharacterized protein n=1 Tax=Vanrija pseudolonga TaxID=143232 RepID=A0AAF0Y4N4_9TREE|nr:hypothetical protein LOC62_01G001563 [Vanrija pseudolonga]
MASDWPSFVVAAGVVAVVFLTLFLGFLVPARLLPAPAFPHRPTAPQSGNTLVRKLRKPADFDEWFRGITACLHAMGASQQFFVDEPCRRTDEDNHITSYRTPGQRAGDRPPSGLQMVQSFEISHSLARRHMDVNWRRWRDAELVARSALARTVDKDLFQHVKDLWSVKDMYNALLVALFPERNDSARAHDLYRHLRGMRLADGATSLDMTIHLNQFRGIVKAHGKCGSSLSADSKFAIFRNSLQGNIRVQVEAAFTNNLPAPVSSLPPKTKWLALKRAFVEHIESSYRGFTGTRMPGDLPPFDSE